MPQANSENTEQGGTPDSVIDDSLFETRLESVYLAEARVYIAGVLMPTTRVTITTTFNRMPEAEIALPAYSDLLYLGEYDRVPVHIFVRETQVECPEFILMFEGFISSTTYVNSALQRSVVVNAVSCLEILNDVHSKMLSQLNDYMEPAYNGAEDVSMFISAPNLVFPNYLLRYGLVHHDQYEDNEPIRFPSDFLENVYAFLQLSHPPKGTGEWEEDPKLGPIQASALTEYFGKHARDLNLLARFERLPYFDKEGSDGKFAWNAGDIVFDGDERATIFPMLYGMQIGYAMGSLASGIINYNNGGGPRTLMDVLAFLVEEMEYEYSVITNPAFHAPEDNGAENVAEKENQEEKERQPGLSEPADKRGRLVSSCLKPLLMDALPPGCNIMYRSMVDNVTAQLTHRGTPTRIRVYNAHSPLALLGAKSNDPLKQVGLIDYYPSKQYEEFDPGEAPKYLRFLTSELLEVEKFCGPTIREVGTPRWLHYMYSEKAIGKNGDPLMLANGEPVDPLKVLKERFLRRQLLLSKYATRRVQISETFDPYVTPGFPGVVYDNESAGFAFAGHVMTVAHTITPTDVSTQVIMDYGRPLSEAAEIEIPNALSFMHNITHKSEPLGEIYQAILGTSGVHLAGTLAMPFSDLVKKATGAESPKDPNNNPKEAYMAKRRNVCTFDRYLKFMDFTAGIGDGPEGPNTPILLYGDFLEKRRPLDVHPTEIIFDPMMSEKEKMIPEQSESPAQASEEKPEEGKQGPLVRVKKGMDPRDMLYLIAKREFSRMIYH